MGSKLLFSESQVNQLVDAKLNFKLIELKLADNPPNSATVVKSKMLVQLKVAEEEIINRHKEATMAWKSAYDNYTQLVVRKIFKTKGVPDPGPAPKIPLQIESLRAWTRALNCLPDNQSNITLKNSDLVSIFMESANAISFLKDKTKDYMFYCTGSSIVMDNADVMTNWSYSSTS